MTTGITYVVRTNLPPEAVSRIATEIFARWLDFALGRGSLNGKRLVYPSGRYASSIQYRQEGESTVAIIADESVAPEAGILEQGHGPVDLKAKLRPGRYPMHRYPGSNAGGGLRRVGSSVKGLKPSIWAEARAREFSGYATLSENSPPGSWIIPAMPAYSPALVLAAMAKKMAAGA